MNGISFIGMITNGRPRAEQRHAAHARENEGGARSSARLGVRRDAPYLDQLESHRLDLRQNSVKGGLVGNVAAEHGVPAFELGV
jgi:hypothetical protein